MNIILINGVELAGLGWNIYLYSADGENKSGVIKPLINIVFIKKRK